MANEVEINRPRRRTAFLLNLIAPPFGYYYAGMPWIGFLCALALIICGAWGLGIKVLDADHLDKAEPSLMTLLFAVASLVGAGLFTGIHAALRRQPRRGRGWRTWLTAGALYISCLGIWFASLIVG